MQTYRNADLRPGNSLCFGFSHLSYPCYYVDLETLVEEQSESDGESLCMFT